MCQPRPKQTQSVSHLVRLKIGLNFEMEGRARLISTTPILRNHSRRQCGMMLADAKAETKAVPKAPAPKRVDLVNDEPELSALIVFSDASSLGVADVTRELLWMSGCLLLHDGPCQLSKSQWRLLVGLTPEHPREREPKDGLDSAGWQSWFEHLQHQRHWLFVVRRSGAIALLQQICFGPSFRLMHRKRASYGALALRTSSRSTFLQLQEFFSRRESMRPWPSPMFLSLQALLFSPGDGKEAAPHVSPSAPVAGTACHSAIHAAAFVAEVVPELLQSQEVVLAVPASVNQADFDALKKTLTTKPMSYVELMSVAANDPVLMSEVPNIHPGKARCLFFDITTSRTWMDKEQGCMEAARGTKGGTGAASGFLPHGCCKGSGGWS
eukprot:symbB.v1.2.034307.t1/scaffold4368.1/size42329/2